MSGLTKALQRAAAAELGVWGVTEQRITEHEQKRGRS